MSGPLLPSKINPTGEKIPGLTKEWRINSMLYLGLRALAEPQALNTALIPTATLE